MVTIDRRILMLGAASMGATVAARPAAAQNFVPDFQQTLQLASNPISAARLELDFWLFASLVVQALYESGELSEDNVRADKAQMFGEFYPRSLFAALSKPETQSAIASVMADSDAAPIGDQVLVGVEALAGRLAAQNINPEAPVIAKALASPVHVARLAPYGPRTGLFEGFEPCKIWVIGLICRLV